MASIAIHPVHTMAEPRGKSAVHRLSLFAVWLTMALAGLVYREPAPVDALMMGLVLLLPTVGLVRYSRGWGLLLTIWLGITTFGFVASVFAVHHGDAIKHTAITLCLSVVAMVIAGFVALRPAAHGKLVMSGYLFAAVVAALAGLAGYYGAVPGLWDVFTEFGRVRSTFKDPNVFAAFVAPAIVYVCYLCLHRPLHRAIGPLVLLGVLTLACMLSFSRGGWANLATGLAVMLYLTFLTAVSNRLRVKLFVVSGFGALLAGLVVMVALQFDDIRALLAERASLVQSYDTGPEGRFGGQIRALQVILDNPLGIGALQFAEFHHPEDAHNVYLSMFLNAGWLGGIFYLFLVLGTVLAGFVHAFRRRHTQALFIAVYAGFVGTALEGVIVDTDHWRHFFILFAVVWGLMLGERRPQPRLRPAVAGVPAINKRGRPLRARHRPRLQSRRHGLGRGRARRAGPDVCRRRPVRARAGVWGRPLRRRTSRRS